MLDRCGKADINARTRTYFQGIWEFPVYIFKAKAFIAAASGASNIFRPRSVNEGLGRIWYSVFATGPPYG
jgi:hypothetical protein